MFALAMAGALLFGCQAGSVVGCRPAAPGSPAKGDWLCFIDERRADEILHCKKMMAGSIRAWAARLKRDTIALWLAARDPRTPWAAKAVAGAVAAYALSPIDLIPDFIPVLGLLDDAILVPLGIALAVRLIPVPLMAEFRAEAARLAERPRSRAGAAIVVVLWALGVALAVWLWAR